MEAEVLKWIIANWPSMFATLVFSMVYIRLHRLILRLDSAEKDAKAALNLMKKIVRLHCKLHPGDIDELWKGAMNETGDPPSPPSAS